MTVMVLGANGFIGPHIVAALEGKAEVVAVSRRGTGPHGVPANRDDVDAIRGLVRERQVTAIIDLLARTEADTLPLLGLDLAYPLTIDCAAFRTACDWTEPSLLTDAIAATIADERARG